MFLFFFSDRQAIHHAVLLCQLWSTSVVFWPRSDWSNLSPPEQQRLVSWFKSRDEPRATSLCACGVADNERSARRLADCFSVVFVFSRQPLAEPHISLSHVDKSPSAAHGAGGDGDSLHSRLRPQRENLCRHFNLLRQMDSRVIYIPRRGNVYKSPHLPSPAEHGGFLSRPRSWFAQY